MNRSNDRNVRPRGGVSMPRAIVGLLLLSGCEAGSDGPTTFATAGGTDAATTGDETTTTAGTSDSSPDTTASTGDASSASATSGNDTTTGLSASDTSATTGIDTGNLDTSAGDTTGGASAGSTETSAGSTDSTTGALSSTTSGGTSGGQQACGPVMPGNEQCLAPGLHITCDDDDDPFHAIGLNCPGDASNSTPISNETFQAQDADTWFVITQFGDSGLWTPTEGDAMLILSTGNLDAPDASGLLVQDAGVTENLFIGMNRNKTNNPDGQDLPVPIYPVDGSNGGQGGTPFMDCDCMNDCSDTLQDQWELGDEEANDLLWFSFDLNVPQGTYGYELDFAWFSSEYPEWVDTQYNDVFLVWSTSETYTGNITFINDQPLTVTALENEIQYGPNSPQLDGTGFDDVGGGTGWYSALGSVAPFETFSLTFAIFDMGDEVLDTAVLIDNWRWTCAGCIPEENGCGIIPQ